MSYQSGAKAAFSRYGLSKVAESASGLFIHPRGSPFGLNLSSRNEEERLPGMHRWVPRDVIERAYESSDQGFDPQAFADLEAERGTLKRPLMGALTGLGAAHFAFPETGKAGLILGGLGGAALAAFRHQHQEDDRRRNAEEAMYGVLREKARDPLR